MSLEEASTAPELLRYYAEAMVTAGSDLDQVGELRRRFLARRAVLAGVAVAAPAPAPTSSEPPPLPRFRAVHRTRSRTPRKGNSRGFNWLVFIAVYVAISLALTASDF